MTKLAKFLGWFYIVIIGLFISMTFIVEGAVIADTINSRNLSDISGLFVITIFAYISLLPGYLLLLLSNRLAIKNNLGEKENTTSLNFFYYWFIGVTLVGILVI
jgi:hypothetical protein